MKIFIDNSSSVLWLCLNILRWTGCLVPEEQTCNATQKFLLLCYFIFWMMVTAVIITPQVVALVQDWGDVSEMTGITFLMFTNMVFAVKAIFIKMKNRTIQAIIDEGEYQLKNEHREEGKRMIRDMNKETTRLLVLYLLDAAVTLCGWVASAKGKDMPLRGWFPYDTTRTPAYQLTFLFQIFSVLFVASTNVSIDQIVATSTAVCRCRFQLLNLSFRTLGDGVRITNKLLTPEEEETIKQRLRACVLQHQAVLRTAAQLEQCFSTSILAQFTVSIVIICVTAYQLAAERGRPIIWYASMTTYFLAMVWQVFFYCNEAHKLSEESSLVSDAVYTSPWYLCSTSMRRSLLIIMLRSRRACVITARGLATLSLSCFVAIIRASYSFFTVLNQLEESK